MLTVCKILTVIEKKATVKNKLQGIRIEMLRSVFIFLSTFETYEKPASVSYFFRNLFLYQAIMKSPSTP